MGNKRRLNKWDLLPGVASSGDAPAAAPYLLNGPDTSGTLTSAVDVLDLATPQPLVATAPFAGTSGAPISLEYDNGAGAANTSCLMPFYHQSDTNARFLAGFVDCTIVDPTDGAEQTELSLIPVSAGAPTGGLVVQSNSAILTGAGNKTITTENGNLTLTAAGAGGDVSFEAGGFVRWSIDGATGNLAANPGGEKLENVLPASAAGEVVVFEQILDAGITTPADGGPAVNIVPGAEFIASASFVASALGSTFLLANNTGKAITLIGARALIPAAGANTLAITIAGNATNLFEAAALAATGGTHLQCATTYTLIAATIANGANITITAQANPINIDTILFLEFIVQ